MLEMPVNLAVLITLHVLTITDNNVCTFHNFSYQDKVLTKLIDNKIIFNLLYTYKVISKYENNRHLHA
jgi:hypothetical protein